MLTYLLDIATVVGILCSAASVSAEQAIWRSPNKDGTNCLFVSLRCAGLSVSYDDYCNRIHGEDLSTLDSLVAAAARFGYEARSRLLTLDDLSKCDVPPICYLELKQGAGRYVSFVLQNHTECLVFDGGPAIIVPMESDEFRKQWTGMAVHIIGTSGRESGVSICIIIVSLALSVGCGWLGSKFRVKKCFPGANAIISPLAGAVVCIVSFTSLASGQEQTDATTASLLTSIRDSAMQTESRLSPITITWTQQYIGVHGNEAKSLEEMNMVGHAHFFDAQSCTFCWQDGRAYLSLARTSSTGGSETKEMAFDGHLHYSGRTLEHSRPFLQKTSVENAIAQKLTGYPIYADFLLAAGFSFPSSYEGWQDPFLRQDFLQRLNKGARLRSLAPVTPDADDVVKLVLEDRNPAQLSEAEAQRQLDEMAFQIDPPERKEALRESIRFKMALPATRLYAYYLDRKYNWSVIKMEEYYDPDQMLVRRECTDFVEVPPRQVWLPRTCLAEYYEISVKAGIGKEPLLKQRFQVVEESGSEIPASRFVLDYKAPGTEVLDVSGSPSEFTERLGRRTFVPGSINDFDKAASPARRSTSTAPLIMKIVNMSLLAVIVVALGFRFYSSRRP